jgi:hypothetical protein
MPLLKFPIFTGVLSSFWLLQAEKEKKPACEAEQIHKMTTIFTQKDNLGPFWVE